MKASIRARLNGTFVPSKKKHGRQPMTERMREVARENGSSGGRPREHPRCVTRRGTHVFVNDVCRLCHYSRVQAPEPQQPPPTPILPHEMMVIGNQLFVRR